MHKIALAGCGRISKNHIEAINQLKAEGLAELVACCDVIPERAIEAAMRAVHMTISPKCSKKPTRIL